MIIIEKYLFCLNKLKRKPNTLIKKNHSYAQKATETPSSWKTKPLCETRKTNTKASQPKQKSRNVKHCEVNNYFSLGCFYRQKRVWPTKGYHQQRKPSYA